MEQDRRVFLQTTVAAGTAALAGTVAVTQVNAQPARAVEPKELPKGMTFATLRRPDGYGLGLRTDAAFSTWPPKRISQNAHPPRSPRCSTAKAISPGFAASDRQGERQGGALFRRRGQGAVRALRHRSGEDRLHRPELSQARGRDRQSRAQEADPVQQVQHRAQPSGGNVACPKEKAKNFDYEAELVIVIGRTARNVSEADALNTSSAMHRQRLHGARPAIALEPVDARQVARRLRR